MTEPMWQALNDYMQRRYGIPANEINRPGPKSGPKEEQKGKPA